ncbi:hypothetical protein [Methanoregula sp. UBA64]|jgi:hypothetical protein|uniref:hypothetical protein n=1 Tax=Methanoregula sp. UBA64 TaxID=1915554 RepID=UPI0025F62EAE|nr:hypothetical protein [Methanoregula sp. UBA64]
MTGTSGSDRHERTRVILTTRTKRAIRELVGTCEYCGATFPPEELDVFQIGMLSSSPERPAGNPANAIIVLCHEHHREAEEGTIRKSDLKGKVTKRTDKRKMALRGLLLKLDRTYEGANVKKSRNPAVFGVKAFVKEQSGLRR